MDRLWREAGQARRPTPRWGVPELPPAEHILHRDSLAYLNRGYLFADLAEPALPEGRGVRAELRRRVTRIAAAVVRFMLERHLVDEREFLIRLVQFENELARKCDVLGDEIRAVASGAREDAIAAREELRLLGERVEIQHRLMEDRLARLEARSPE